MGCRESVPIPPTSQPQLVGIWVNTEKAAQMDPDLGGQSSPVRIKAINVSDGQYTCRRGTSPLTEKRPAATDRTKLWVRLIVGKDGRVRYEQLDHNGRYYVLDFPVTAPWKEPSLAEEEPSDNANADHRHHPDETKETDAEEVKIEPGPARVESGTMEYRNCFGETRARINFEYIPRLASAFEETKHSSSSRSVSSSSSGLSRRRSTLRITPCGTGNSHLLVRERRSSRHSSSQSTVSAQQVK